MARTISSSITCASIACTFLGGSGCRVKKNRKGRKTTASNYNYFDRYGSTVANQYNEIHIVVEMTRRMGDIRKSIVLCPFFARGLAQRRLLVSDECTTAQRIRQVVGEEKLIVFIHVTSYHYQDGVIGMDLLMNKSRYRYTREFINV